MSYKSCYPKKGKSFYNYHAFIKKKELVSFVIPTKIKAEFNCTSGNEMEKRSVAHDPINGRSKRSKAETCDGKSLSSCRCLQDGYSAAMLRLPD